MKYAVPNTKILEISSSEDVYSRGETYYREGKLISFHAKRQGESSLIKASVKGNYRNYDVSLNFDAGGELVRYNCSCASQSIWHGGCKHVVAVLFALSDGRTPTGAGTKFDTESLTDTLEKLILQEIDDNLDVSSKTESNRLARLVPRFHYCGDGEGYLTFYVGYSRMYTIKSLPKFIAAINNSATVRYGNGLEFNHDMSSFNYNARRWIDFLKQEEEIYTEMLKKYHHPYPVKEDTRELPLSRRNMDTFFELCGLGDNQVEANMSFFADAEEPVTLRLTTDKPNIRFKITETNKLILEINPLKNPLENPLDSIVYHVLEGQRHNYFLAQNTIYRMSKSEALLLKQILDHLLPTGQIVLTGYAHRRFISAVLPKLNLMGLVGDSLCPNLRAKMYFDSEGRDVIGRVVFDYDRNQYDAFDRRENNGPRDVAGEYMTKRLLEGLGFVPDAENRVFRLSGSDNLYDFLADEVPGINKLQDFEKAEIYITDNLKRRTVKAGLGSLGVRLRGNLLDINITGADFTLSELAEALESYRAKKKYHRLKDGRLLSLTDKATADMADSLTALDIAEKDIQKDSVTMPLYRAPYIEGIISNQNGAFKNLMKQFHAQNSFAVPESLQSIMRPYQKVGFHFLKNLVACGFGGILADDMGLGKTLQVLAVLLELNDEPDSLPALVVAPTSLLYNWAAEIKKFAPALPFAVVAGTPERRLDILMTPGIKVFITTYDAMKRDAEIYMQAKYKYVIADEAQNIKNPATKNAKVIKSIEADHRFALTGTPIENTLTELWSLFDFVMPGYLHSLSKFSKLYEAPITKDNNKDRAARLKEQISPFILRRLKNNVLDELPPKTETNLMAEMLPEQQKIYMAHLLKAKGELKALLSSGPLKGGKLQILAQLTRLRQICCHPSLCIENYKGGSGKLDLALETIEIAIESGHRVLLFSQFTEMLSILRGALQKTGTDFFYLDGATPASDRIDRVNRFNDGEADVFLISLKAGGTGLNLTGADVVIHYDPWWNPSVMDQASDRAYRLGQNKAVMVFNLVAMQTLEERIMELQSKKRKLIDSMLNDEGFMGVLTDAEIEQLLDDVAR